MLTDKEIDDVDVGHCYSREDLRERIARWAYDKACEDFCAALTERGIAPQFSEKLCRDLKHDGQAEPS